MKRLLVLFSFTLVLYLLGAQTEYWHTYYPGGWYPDDHCLQGSTVWVASNAGLMHLDPETGECTQYNQDNAPFSTNRIHSLCLDHADMLWVGVPDGIRSFDGESWHSYDAQNSSLPAATVLKIVEDSNDAIWFATNNGLARFRDNQWDAFTSANSQLPESYTVADLKADHDGGIWLATDHGLFHFDGANWESFVNLPGGVPFKNILQIAIEQNGVCWFRTSGSLLKYENGFWTTHTELNGVSLSSLKGVYVDLVGRFWILKADTLLVRTHDSWQEYSIDLFAEHYLEFRTLLSDESGILWLGMFDTSSPQSLYRFDGTNIDRYSICELPLASYYITEIFRGFDDKLWISTTEGKGNSGYLSIEDGIVECFGKYNTPSMPCAHVWALGQDQNLNMWISTCIGLVRTGPDGSQVYHSADTGIDADYQMCICAVDDGIWYGGDDGVTRYQNGHWSVLTNEEAGMNLEGCKVIKTDSQNRVWIGSTAGVCYYDNGEFSQFTNIGNVRDFAFGANADVWVAHGAISHYQNGIWTTFSSENSGLSQDNVRTLALDQNQVLWAGTEHPQGRIYRFDGDNWTYLDSSNSPLQDFQINSLFADENDTIWIGSKYLYCYNEGGLPTSIQAHEQVPPAQYGTIYPNPFREQTTIRFSKHSSANAQINIFNLKGQKLRSYQVNSAGKAEPEIVWDGLDNQGRACASGLYLIQINDGARSFVMKALRLK